MIFPFAINFMYKNMFINVRIFFFPTAKYYIGCREAEVFEFMDMIYGGRGSRLFLIN